MPELGIRLHWSLIRLMHASRCQMSDGGKEQHAVEPLEVQGSLR